MASGDPGGFTECTECGTVALGPGTVECCAGRMTPVDGDLDGVEAPSLDELLRAVFDMSGTELDVCLCVMEGGEQTVKDLAARVDYDRSVVARHLNHLVDLGVVEKRRRLLEGGGHAYLYSPEPPEVVRRQFRRLFLAWVRDGGTHIDELRREKVEAIVASDADDPQWQIYLEES